MSDDTVRVAIRIRPLVKREIEKGCQMSLDTVPGEPQILIKNSDKSFTYNYVFSSETDQEEFYNIAVKDMVINIFQGYNVTILAYGQTGSGKTHSMGTNYDGNTSMGIIPRAVHDIFNTISTKTEWEFKVTVSFMELYQEQLYDLLSDKERSQTMVDIREENKEIKIVGITEKPVKNAEDALKCLTVGSAGRITGATAMNEHSSRSHAIYTLCIHQQKIDVANTAMTAKFHLVDLAGSERSKKTGATGERFKEGININKGLLALGNVISQLGEGGPISYVGYRDSKLTRLLQDSLGGNSKTLMIACVSPADYNLDETISTLRYADRARRIKNKPVVNQDPKVSEINRLNKLVQELRLALVDRETVSACPNEHQVLEEQNRCLQKKVRDLTEKLNANLLEVVIMHERSELAEQSREKIQANMTIILADFDVVLNDENLSSECRSKLEDIRSKILDIQKDQKKTSEDLINHGMFPSFKEPATEEPARNSITDVNGDDSIEFYDEKQEEHTLRQAERIEEVQNLNRELAVKEGLISQLLKNSLQMTDQFNEVQQMEQEIKTLQAEKEELSLALQNAQTNNASSKLAETRRKKVQELEKKITELTRKCVEQNRVIKTKEKQDLQIKNLSNEIQSLKQVRVKLIRQMRSDNDRFASWKKLREKELNKLKDQDRKLMNEMTRMRLKHHKQESVFKRRMEEVFAVNKRLKEALEMQKKASQRADKASSNKDSIQTWITQEYEVIVSTVQAENSLKKLLQDRASTAAQLQALKDSDKPSDQEQIEGLTNFLEIRNAQINDLQEKILESDQENRANTRLHILRTMADARTALKILFDISAQEQKKLNDLMEQNEFLQSRLERQKRYSKQVLNESKQILLNDSLHSTDNGKGENTDLQKELEFYKNKCAQLEQTVLTENSHNKKANRRTVSRDTSQKIDTVIKEEVFFSSDDSLTLEDDVDRDPDWKQTPLYHRIQSLWKTTKDQTTDRTSLKRRSGDEIRCACKTKCATRICSCRKNDIVCNSACGCNVLDCQNKDKENVARTLFLDNSDDLKATDLPKKRKV